MSKAPNEIANEIPKLDVLVVFSSKKINLSMKVSYQANEFFLEFYSGELTFRPKYKFPVKSLYVELEKTDYTRCTLSIISPEYKFLIIATPQKEPILRQYFNFISRNSVVNRDNEDIISRDLEIRSQWNLPFQNDY